jgi:hypothetical protein
LRFLCLYLRAYRRGVKDAPKFRLLLA